MPQSSLTRRDFFHLTGMGMAATFATTLPAFASNKPVRSDTTVLPLHFNENSLGMSPKALSAAQAAIAELGNRYPDDMVAALRHMLADKHGVSTQQILFGNGSTEIIRAVVATAAQQKAKLLEPAPTFGAARRYARNEGMEVITVPVGQGFKTDIEALRKRAEAESGPLLINVCNPNNPTGTLVDHERLVAWLNTAPANHVFLLDEAYHDYAQLSPSYQSQVERVRAGRENLVVARTFSKIYGMAGMRIGYGIAAPATAARVKGFAAGFNLSAPGIAAAMASLQDEVFYQRSLQSNQQSRRILLATLAQLSLPCIPSHTNFVLHRINGKLENYAKRMQENHIKVGRRMTKEDGWNRISLGTPAQMQEFAKTLAAFRQKGWV